VSAPSTPVIPRQPIGATFVVAVSVLGVFAILQIVAVAWHYVPAMRQQMQESSRQAAAQPVATPAPMIPQVAAQALPSQAPPQNAQLNQKVTQLLQDADRNARIGEYDDAIKLLDQAEALLPGDPTSLFLRSQVLERMGQPGDAMDALQEALKYPALPPEYRAQAERKLDQLARFMTSTGQTVPTKAQDAPADDSGASIRDDVGLQPGAVLGIVDVRAKDAEKPGLKKFQVSVKVRPGAKIDTSQVQVAAFFYDRTEDGEVSPTESKVKTQWISQPVDWAEEMPEILEITDILPDSDLPGSAASNGSPGRKYEGYVVGVYYNKELQDFRADPASLQKKFPLQLYLPASPDNGAQ